MKKIYLSLPIITALTVLAGCKSNSDPVATVDTTLNASVISDFSTNIAVAEYTGLAQKTALMYTQAQTLNASRTTDNLTAIRQTWRDARKIWEQSEAQLFGPVETDNIDPHIDTWPVDFNALNDQLKGSQEFTPEYINSLDDALKGFHPIEFILWGQNGDKAASALTDREMNYLIALTLNVKTLTADLNGVWDTGSTTSFYHSFVTAGAGSAVYTTQQSALEQLVSAMADICGEVADSKMKDPYDAQDPTLEESPFAKSSMTDFINNITGIQNVYTGKFQTDGVGIEDIVRKYNLSLDNTIKTKLATALAAMNAISEPFGDAIIDQHTQVETAMSAIRDLKSSLEDDLLPFVHLHSN